MTDCCRLEMVDDIQFASTPVRVTQHPGRNQPYAVWERSHFGYAFPRGWKIRAFFRLKEEALGFGERLAQ